MSAANDYVAGCVRRIESVITDVTKRNLHFRSCEVQADTVDINGNHDIGAISAGYGVVLTIDHRDIVAAGTRVVARWAAVSQFDSGLSVGLEHKVCKP